MDRISRSAPGTVLFMLLFLTLLSGMANGKKTGVTDRDLSIAAAGQGGQGACGVNCHLAVKAGAAISITANPCCTYTPGQTNINVSVTTSGIGNVDTILGIMLLNNAQPYNLNIKGDGWTIDRDPNNNANPTAKNYNQKTGLLTLDQKFNWTLTAPLTPGTYYVLAHARFGMGPANNDDRNATSAAISMTVQSPVPEFPFGTTLAFSTTALMYILMRHGLE